MTILAQRCALLEIAVDPGRLYFGDDPTFEVWLSGLADAVEQAKREAYEEST